MTWPRAPRLSGLSERAIDTREIRANTAVQAARPPEPDPDQKRDAAIEAPESELDRLVKAEEYEKAAQVRDQIRTLKEQAG
ncbi:MAG: UvrB/UvrC motif-containing protein [Planctomycetes bacterium]|nr:UvrB/UvrC motif-containing protein [Planctomycetota bacterium]